MKATPTIKVSCPKCGARPNRPCRGSRIPSASTLGGGWGGPPTLSRPHSERVQARKDLDQYRAKKRAEWKARRVQNTTEERDTISGKTRAELYRDAGLGGE